MVENTSQLRAFSIAEDEGMNKARAPKDQYSRQLPGTISYLAWLAG